MAGKLHPQAQRLRTIIVTVPIIGATACMMLFTTTSGISDSHATDVLYERLVHGKPQRTLPPQQNAESGQQPDTPGKGAEKIGTSTH